QGAQDPTPAFRTFTATTIAPEVDITVGPFFVCPSLCDINAEYVFFEWHGNDPDGNVVGFWYKWNADLSDYPTHDGPDPSVHGWTFLPADSTTIASRQSQRFPGCTPRANTFAVFAEDDAGAIQQVSQCGRNWACFCPTTGVGGPGICID